MLPLSRMLFLRLPLLSLSLFSVLLTTAAPALAMSTILNDTFDSPPAPYAGFNGGASDNTDDISTAGFSDSASGGNPGGHGVVEHFHEVNRDGMGNPANGDGNVYMQSVYTNTAVTYNPATSGAIMDMSFMFDIRFENFGPEGGLFSDLFFIISDTSGASAVSFQSFSKTPGWQSFSALGLVESDFFGINFSGNEDLTFGFGFVSFGDVTNADELLTLDVDNFKVQINAVPEPNTALLMGLGLVALGASGHRREG